MKTSLVFDIFLATNCKQNWLLKLVVSVSTNDYNFRKCAIYYWNRNMWI